MARTLDIAWLKDNCADNASRAWIDKIIAWRNYTLENNLFVEDKSSFILNLGRYALRFNASSAHATIEVYHEIFKENAHFLVSGFDANNYDVVLDIGANQGFYTLKLKEICPDCKIIAVEPNPAEYSVLCENIALNSISNVILENSAIGFVDGTLRMEVIPEIGAIGGQMLRIPERPWIKDEFVKVLEVPAVTLDTLFEKHAIEKVDLLKMDVEGLELEILQSCSKLSQIKRIVTEYHSMQIKEDLIQHLKDNGFLLVFEDPSPSNSYSGDIYFENKLLK